MTEPSSGLKRDPVEELLESFLARWRQGERPGLDEYVARCPDRADEIRELFPAMIEMEQLKPAVDVATGSLVRPTTRPDSAPLSAAPHPEHLGDFKILRVVGEGGMGVVYEAEHESLKNRVALKVMHRRFRADRSYLRRFHTEARSAARLHHTNIVPVFDFGEQDGVCYYAMQFIAGFGLDLVLDDVRRLRAEGGEKFSPDGPALPGATETAVSAVTRGLMTGRFATAPETSAGSEPTRTQALGDGPTQALDFHAPNDRPSEAPVEGETSSSANLISGQSDVVYFREVARLGAQVADALDYAHRQKVVHRDIKPSNLLLDAQGNVWVTDFGLAKLVEGEDLSQSHDLVGTLRFMAPERLRGVTDRRSDIYALGATLYEMLTLHPAFPERDQVKLIDQIAHHSPPPLRQHDPRIPRDLETIVHKALAKDPGDRCDKASELRDELRRFLDGRPTRWRRVGPVEQFRRWCKRNPWLAAANITAAVLTTVLAIGSTIAAWIYRDQRDQIGNNLIRISASEAEARGARTEAREALFKALLDRARAGRFSHRVGQRFDSLAALAEAARIGRELKLPAERLDRLRDEAIACMALVDMKPAGPPIHLPEGTVAFAFDEGMTRYAIRLRDGTVLVRRMGDDQEIARFKGEGDREIWVFIFSPDGRYLASMDKPTGAVRVWDIQRSEFCLRDPGAVSGTAARFCPDSRRIAMAHDDGSLLVYDLKLGQPVKRFKGPAAAQDLAYRGDGKQIAIAYHTGPPSCCILDGDEAVRLRTFNLPGAGSVSWSPDGTTVATTSGADPPKIHVWDAATGERRAVLEGATSGGLGAVFHPSGALLASHGWEGRLRLWDAVLGRQILSVTGGGRGWFSRDGRIFLPQGNELTPWQVEPALEYRSLPRRSPGAVDYHSPCVHPGGRILASGTIDGVVLWDLARGTEIVFLRIGLAWNTMFDVSGDLLTNGEAGVWRWPVKLEPSSRRFRIGPPRRLPLPGTDCVMSLDRTGRIIATSAHNMAFVAVGDRTLKVGPLDDCRSVTVCPDGQWLATGSSVNGGAAVWKLPEGSQEIKLPVEGAAGVCFSPNGKWLVTAQAENNRLWEVGTWRAGPRFGEDFRGFSPDGREVLVRDSSNTLILMEVESGRTLARFDSPDQHGVGSAVLSPDGSRLVVDTRDLPPCVHVWDLRAIRRRLVEMGLDWDAPAYPDDDPARADLPPLPPLEIDYGPLAGHLELYSERREVLVERSTARIKKDPNDAEAYHLRGHALLDMKRSEEALADFTVASAKRPQDVHLHANRGICLFLLKRYAHALDELEMALRINPQTLRGNHNLQVMINNRAWELANGTKLERDPAVAVRLAELAVALTPDDSTSLNTLGVALYRAGDFTRSIETLERSLAASKGQSDGFDLVFLATAHHGLGHRELARDRFGRAVTWLQAQKSLTAQHAHELAAFRAEAEAVLGLASPGGDLPDDVFGSGPAVQ
jgi:serine/threonine protein kinase/WD40 repeat protein/tetratricopeptide (TPR) repeat protein